MSLADLNGLLRRDVVTHPRHVANDVAIRLGPRHRGGVVAHVVGRHLEGVVVAEHDHRKAVAHEDEVGAGFARHPRTGRVVGGDHDQRFFAITGLVSGNRRGGEFAHV